MSITNLRIWSRTENRGIDRQESKQASNILPSELRSSVISQYRMTNDNDRNRDLFWAAKSGDVAVLERYFNDGTGNGFECNCLDQHNLSPLHYAAKYNRTKIIDKLLAYGADINCIGSDGVSPTVIASKYNAVEALRMLIIRNCSLNITDANGETALHHASRLGHVEACKVLLDTCPTLLDQTDKDMMSALHLASMKGRADVCLTLLERGANISTKSINGSVPIHYAAAKGSINVIKLLLDYSKADFSVIDQINAQDNEQQTPLHKASQKGRKDALKLCIESGGNIFAVQKDGQTPLHVAVASGRIEAVKVLITHGAEFEARDNSYRTPLHIASSCGYIDIIEYLLKNGANIDSVDGRHKSAVHHTIEKDKLETLQYLLSRNASVMIYDDRNQSCIHMAAVQNRIAVMQELLSNEAINLLNEIDSRGRTAMHCAAEAGNYNIIRLLASKGALIDVSDGDDNTPLHLACLNGNMRTIQYISQQVPSLINSLGENSRTPLHMAVLSCNPEATEFCLNFGANADKRDGSYTTPIEIAVRSGYANIVNILLQYGVSANVTNSSEETLLHIAAAQGYAEIAVLLLKYGANLMTTDVNNLTSLDFAIHYKQESVANIFINHANGKLLLKRINKDGRTTMQHMIQNLPNVAKTVMDSSISRQETKFIDESKKSYRRVETLYDFSLLDPNPEVKVTGKYAKSPHKRNGLITMMESRNIDLLNHPLAAKLRDAKWRKYGQYFYYVNLCIYLAFVVALTVYIIYAEDIYVFYTFEREPIKGLDWASSGRLPTTSAATLKPTFELNSKSAPVNATLPPYRTDANLAALVEFLGVFAWINLTKEIFQLYNQGMHYFKSFSNYIDLAIYLSLMATGFITVADITYTLYSVIIFLAYVNLLLAMERLDFIGVYVHMLQSVLATVVNTLGIVVILSMGFALSFTILNPRQATFYSLPLAFIKVLNMMIGEMDYDGTWFDNIKSGEIVMPESVVSLLMIGVFIFIMPVIVMNLMVGLAVGDIDKVRREADLRMLSSRLEYLDNLERTFPFRFKHYFYIGFQTEYITKDLENMSDEEFNSSWKDSGILDTTKDHEDPKKEKDKLTVVSDQLKDQEQRIDSLTKNISILSDRMNALHETVGKQFESLQDEIKKMVQSNSLHSLPRVE